MFGRRQDSDFDEEIRAHLQHEVDQLIADGHSPADARARALKAFGNVNASRERFYESRRWILFEHFLRDVRFAVRSLASDRGFTAVAVLTLALGIGANVAVFGLLDALMFDPINVREPDRLVRFLDGQVEPRPFRASEFFALQDRMETLAGLAATERFMRPGTVGLPDAQHAANVELVSGNYFNLLGVSASEGRPFAEPDTTDPGAGVVVISDAYWRRQYGGSRAVLGTRLRYNNKDYRILGVADPGFTGTFVDVPTEIWIPFDQFYPPGYLETFPARLLHLVGRMEPGRTVEDVSAEAAVRFGRPVGAASGATGFSTLRAEIGSPLSVLALFVGVVLLIACANVANLGMARAAARDHEFATRTALGASRIRLVVQGLTESLVLAAAGVAGAIPVASGVTHGLLGLFPPEWTYATGMLEFRADLRTLTLAAAILVLTTLATGLLPARAISLAPAAALRRARGIAPDGRRWAGRSLVVSEMALSTFLLVVTGLLAGTLWNLKTIDTGIDRDTVTLFDIVRPEGLASDEERQALVERLRREVAAQPGVESAALGDASLLSGLAIEWNIETRAVPFRDDADALAATQTVSPDFFRTLGIPIRAGREFDRTDTTDAVPVAVVNQTFVRRFLPGENAIGRRFTRIGRPPDLEVVGVVDDTRWINLRDTPPPTYYTPLEQTDWGRVLSVRGPIRFDQVAGIARSVNPGLTIRDPRTVNEMVNRSLVTERMTAYTALGYGLLAMLIAGVGLYGVMSYGVAVRKKEIGVRMALGADRTRVVSMILGQSLRWVMVGLLLGLPAAAIGGRLVDSMLFGLTPLDPRVVVLAVLVLLSIAVLASWIPARRASGADPMVAIRHE